MRNFIIGLLLGSFFTTATVFATHDGIIDISKGNNKGILLDGIDYLKSSPGLGDVPVDRPYQSPCGD